MAAIVLDEAGVVNTRTAVGTLRADFSVPPGKVMSWKDHVKTHDRRRRAADVLAQVEGLRVCFVYASKEALRDGTYKDDPTLFYNYVAGRTYKAALWAARNVGGWNARVWTRFGHVRGHNHELTDQYLQERIDTDPKVPHHMEQGRRWVSADRYVESSTVWIFFHTMRRYDGST